MTATTPRIDDIETLIPEAGQLLATAVADDADAGYVGEYMENSTSRAAAVALTTATAATVAFITLTPGDWDVSAAVGFIPPASTSITALMVKT